MPDFTTVPGGYAWLTRKKELWTEASPANRVWGSRPGSWHRDKAMKMLAWVPLKSGSELRPRGGIASEKLPWAAGLIYQTALVSSAGAMRQIDESSNRKSVSRSSCLSRCLRLLPLGARHIVFFLARWDASLGHLPSERNSGRGPPLDGSRLLMRRWNQVIQERQGLVALASVGITTHANFLHSKREKRSKVFIFSDKPKFTEDTEYLPSTPTIKVAVRTIQPIPSAF